MEIDAKREQRIPLGTEHWISCTFSDATQSTFHLINNKILLVYHLNWISGVNLTQIHNLDYFKWLGTVLPQLTIVQMA